MKKFYLLTKTLLVAALLMIGANAWAGETTTTYDFEDGNAVFTGDSRITVAIEDNAALSSKVVGFTCAGNAQNGYSFAHYDFSSLVAKASKVTVNFDYYNTKGGRAIVSIGDASVRGTTGGSSKTTYNGSGAMFRLGSDKNNAILNDKTATQATYCDKWLNVNVVINLETKKMSYTIIDKSTSEEIYSEEDVDYYNSDGVACSQIDVFGYINNSHCAMIDNLSITNYVDESVKYAGYTIKYMCGETEIKEAVTDRDVVKVGETATLIPADKDAIWYESKKYVYVSDNSSTQTIVEDGSTVITVNFEEAATYTYSVTDNFGNAVASGSAYAGEDVTYYVPYYVFKEGKFYQDPTPDVGTRSYGACTIKAISANTDVTVTYTEEENTNVVFFSEAENLDGVTPYGDNFTNIRMSDGKVGYYSDQAAFVTLPAGIYTLTTSTRVGKTTFYAGAVGEGAQVAEISATGAVNTVTSDPFILAGETDIYTSVGSVTAYFDYVIIRRTGDVPASVSATVTSAGYATFSSIYPVSIPDGVEAYAVKYTGGNTVSLNKVDAVPANTGVVLKAAEGVYDLPVATAGAIDTDLLPSDGSVTGDGSIYVLADDKGIGFYKLANGNTLEAGKAYLKIENNARGFIGFDETTGVNEVNVNKAAVAKTGKIYNLNGQIVSKPSKGLFIVDGKVVSF